MIVRNRFIPFGSFLAINLCGLIFVRSGHTLTPRDLNHERIHSRQQRELLYLPFFLLYVAEWLVRLMQTRPLHRLLRADSLLQAYHRISFEREAYAHQDDLTYLRRRQPYAWRHHLHTRRTTGGKAQPPEDSLPADDGSTPEA